MTVQRYIACFALLLAAVAARAELTIEITSGVDDPAVIAVSPINLREGTLDQEISDLRRPGTQRPFQSGAPGKHAFLSA